MAESRTRSVVAVAVSVACLAFIVAALWPRSSETLSDAERVADIASRMQCPFCNGESIADATSQVARDLEARIGELVADGLSDGEIFDYFAERYGERLLLDPPLLGWGWALWALPLFAVGLGVFAVMRRRRTVGASVAPVGALEEEQLREQLAIVERDRAEIAAQLESGELDEDTRRELLSSLDAEAAAVSQALAAAPPPASPAAEAGDTDGSRRRRLNRRALVGVSFLVLGAFAVGITLAVTAGEDNSGGIVDAPPIDLASVTSDQLEQVVAANPEVVPMRLVLAGMLLEEGDVLGAAQHYGEVIRREPDNPEALAALGWISFLVDENETAESYLEDALAVEPGYAQAQWWLANVRLLGLDDPAGAIAPLEAVLSSGRAPEEVRLMAEQMLAEARSRL